MRHYFDAVLHPSTGAALEGVLVRIFDENDALVDIYADENSTPIETVSGEANAAKTDSDGMFSLYVGEGAYTVRFYQGDTVLKTITNVNLGVDVTRMELSDTTGAALVGDLLPGSGPVAGTVADKLAALVPFEDFLPKDYDYTTDDCSAALVTAATWSADNNATVVFSKRYRIANCATLETSARFHFDGARFDVLDTGTSGTLTNGATGKIGILFKNADNLHITGSARFVGFGTLGVTTLAGIVFDHCDFAEVAATFHFQTMAAGMFVMWCDNGNFGDVTAYQMNGQQTFDAGSAGTARVVTGCVNCDFGKTHSIENHKPVLYCSPGLEDGTTAVSNANCTFGMVSGTGASGSMESCLLGLRDALNCTFEGATGTGFTQLVDAERYITDAGFAVDGNIIGRIRGTVNADGASVNAALVSQGEDATVPIGKNTIESLVATCGAASEYGAFVTSGEWDVAHLEIDGSVRPVMVNNATLRSGKVIVRNQDQEAVNVGLDGHFQAELVDVQSGSGGAGSAVRYNSSFGTGAFGSINIKLIRYRQNGIGTNLGYAIFDPSNGPANWNVGHVDGSFGTADGLFIASDYFISNGVIYKAAVPGEGTFPQGYFVANSAPAANGIAGWRCVAAGTPGTWVAERSIQQQAAVADASGGTTVDAEARTAINAVIARLEAAGILAP